jgi:hypothetical protein
MSKIGTESFGEHLLSDVARVMQDADRAAYAVMERQHLCHWHPASTAPHNQDLERRVVEEGTAIALPFPCRHINTGEWISVDLGVPLQIQPLEWRAWQRGKSPDPHLSSIFSPLGAARRRREQWSGRHEGPMAL